MAEVGERLIRAAREAAVIASGAPLPDGSGGVYVAMKDGDWRALCCDDPGGEVSTLEIISDWPRMGRTIERLTGEEFAQRRADMLRGTPDE